MSDERTLIEIVAGFWLTVITMLIGYNTKRIGEIPEKYVQKSDFNILRKEINENFIRTHERLDKLIEQRKEVRDKHE